jgi:pimeloyl-ACP methyl ester carboxylesterase
VGIPSKLPVIFIPGLGCDERLYSHQVLSLEKFGYITKIVNNREIDNNKALADDILRNSPEKFHIIGLSMGGYPIFEILKQHPDRIGKAIFLNTQARADTKEKIKQREDQINVIKNGEFDKVKEDLWQVLVEEKRVSDKTLKALYISMSENVTAKGFITQLSQIISRDDSTNFLQKIKNQCLVVAGKQDKIFSLDLVKEIADGINSGSDKQIQNSAQFEVIENCGHLSTIEQPEKVSKIILDFLSN